MSVFGKDLVSAIDLAMGNARKGTAGHQTVYKAPSRRETKNQYCLFLKPWSTLQYPDKGFWHLLEMVFAKISLWTLQVDEIYLISGEYLDRYRVMQGHYNVLFRSATNAACNLSEAAKQTFQQAFGISAEHATILGGYEFLSGNPGLSVDNANLLWSKSEHIRLAPGTFCGRVCLAGQVIYLINGFTPKQFQSYSGRGSVIVVLALSGGVPWSAARNEFLGASVPAKAAKGSIRNELASRASWFGLEEVSVLKNGAHLSAGPVEALVELCRFGSNYLTNDIRTYWDYQFGRRLSRVFTPDAIASILEKPGLGFDSGGVSIFDITENLDEHDAISVLRSFQEAVV